MEKYQFTLAQLYFSLVYSADNSLDNVLNEKYLIQYGHYRNYVIFGNKMGKKNHILVTAKF